MHDRTSVLYLESLPPHTTKGTLVRLLEQVGQIDRRKIGSIEIRGRMAVIEVPGVWVGRLLKALDGAALGTRNIRATAAGPPAGNGGPPAENGEDHFLRMIRLLELEGRAEAEAALRDRRRGDLARAETSGTTLVDLAIRDEQLGLGGRVLLSLGKRDLSQRLPWIRFGLGAPVLLSDQLSGESSGWRGVVSDVTPLVIQIALEQSPEPDSDRPLFRLDLSHDEVVRQRQRAALERARVASGGRLAELRDVLLGFREPRFGRFVPGETLNGRLNASQQEAVAFAMSAQDVAIIHGPPGTGKTTTVVELIHQAVRRGERVLVCAPSNLAVDNVLERLLVGGARAVRLGHPARVLPELRDHTLDLIVERQDDVKLARKLVRKAQVLCGRAARFTRAKPEPGQKREMREEARQLLADARRLESLAVQQILDQAEVLCATTTGLDSEVLGQRSFDLAVVDEACQSTEPGCWIPLLRCQRLVLAGDHCQLPPTIISADAAREGFAVSLLERLVHLNPQALSRQLVVQYRMHAQIMEFPSREFYEGSLIADETVRSHQLEDLPLTTRNEWTTRPLEFIDTAGANYDEQVDPDGESRWNPHEAEVVRRCIHGLLAAGVPATDIGLIAPYAAQVRHLRKKLPVDGLEIDTVDGFQGREKEAIVVSLVRSNPSGEIGFLADVRRMNVALTRARRKLIVIGDSATIANDPFYERWLAFIEHSGAYRTVWELASE